MNRPVVLAVAMVAGCSAPSEPDQQQNSPVVQSVVLTSAVHAVEVGGTLRVVASVHMSDGSIPVSPNVAFSSSDVATALVSTTGYVTGVRQGSVTITATSGGRSGTLPIAVTQLAGSYQLSAVQNQALPVNILSESCVQPPLTVCSSREWVTSGTLVLTAGGLATLTTAHRTDITTASGTTSAPTSDTWSGTWTHAGTGIALALAHSPTGSIPPIYPVGAVQGTSVTISLQYSGSSFAHRFTRP